MVPSLDTSAFGTRRPPPRLAAVLGLTRCQPDTWLGRRVAFGLQHLALPRIEGPVDVEAMDARLRLYPFDNLCEKRILFTPQYFDQAERVLIRSRIRDGFVFVDIGANIGGYALSVAAAAGPEARILAVEPQPGIFERLVYNIAQNPRGAVKAVACALGDHDGELTLFLRGDNRGASSVRFVPSDGRAETVKVPSKTLLTLAREEGLARIDVAKLDVEGAEDLILMPFLRDAPEDLWPRLLVLSKVMQRWQADVLGALAEHGYRRTLETRLNLAFERP
ncbi:FkbM family methyltransferase [Labrys wisconsinensis]|uniref:FkbM family methyltransferase n=1 Tax=Labrys wisconsinensis TaxID=425677 RepID=A0ABU0J5C0_9HYPH|nr:FkbM family methyltransferase [Labrys wisconsinensis]MDQ0469458.1 FkbM family methyltransferase [Labrys wisconsinensis]